MANKFRTMRGEQPPPKRREAEPAGDMLGHDSSKSPQILPLNTASTMEHVKADRGELRKDVGWAPLGTGLGTIIGLIEHKWLFGGQLFSRILRFINEGGVTRSQYWDGDTWVESTQASEPMLSVYASLASIQGCLLLADGERIMRWCEDISTIDLYEDFTAGLLLDAVAECTNEVVIDPALAVDNEYTVHFGIEWTNIPTTQEAVIELVLSHNGSDFGTRLFRYRPGMTLTEAITTQDKEFKFRRPVDPGDTFKFCIGSNSVAVEEDYIDILLSEVVSSGATFTLPPPAGLVSYRYSYGLLRLVWVNTVSDAEIEVWFNQTGILPTDTAQGNTIYAREPAGSYYYESPSVAYYNVLTPHYAAVRYKRGNQYSVWVFYIGAP